MKNNSFVKDFSWYFIASFIPLLIGLVKTSIFTRHFDSKDYGFLGIVTITFSFIGMLLFSWIGSCLWRFYSRYKSMKSLSELYSNLMFLFFISFISLSIIALIWFKLSDGYLIKKMIIYSFFLLLINQLCLFYLVVIRLRKKAKLYSTIQFFKASVGILLALLFVFYFQLDISVLILSLAIADFILLLFLLLYNPVDIRLDFKLIKKNTLLEFLLYGSIGLILNISLLIISYSDRYIIAYLTDYDNVGIYDQVSKISQLSIIALITIYFNTINPILLNRLEKDYKNSISLIQGYIKQFILFGLPFIFYISIFSEDIANILLGKSFRSAYTIMPFIFLSSYLHGFSNFFELRLKFSMKYKLLARLAILTALLNIVLNIIFIPLFNYKWAAFTTAVSYMFLVSVFYYYDKEVLNFSNNMKIIFIKIIGVLIVQTLIYLFLNTTFEVNLGFKLIMLLLFCATYYLFFNSQFKSMNFSVDD